MTKKLISTIDSGWFHHLPVTAVTAWKAAHEVPKSLSKVNDDRQDRAELNDYGEHLPVFALDVLAHELLRDADMRGGADR